MEIARFAAAAVLILAVHLGAADTASVHGRRTSLPLSAARCIAAPQAPKLSASLHEVVNLRTLEPGITFSKQDLAMLRKNWFFVAPSDSYNVFDVYGQNDEYYIPSLVTADNAVQLLHVCFDSVLEEMERTKLSSGARKMSAALLAAAVKDWKAAARTPMADASAKNVAYFAVADRLSGGQDPIPAPILPMVKETLALINAHQAFAEGPIFPYRMDFSQFVPRGHYAHTSLLGRYFRTIMWFGLTPFSAPKEPGDSLEPIRQGLLMSHELTHSDQLARWNRMYDVTSILVGPSNHLTPLECEATAKTVFGPAPSFKAWADPAKLNVFVKALANVRPPLFNEVTPDEGSSKVQVRFMGQRSVPDSYILQTLAVPRLRPDPSPLDVMSVIGSSRALSIENANPSEYNPNGWSDYVPLRTKLIAEFKSEATGTWTSDIYWAWMGCLRALITPPEATSQPFLNTSAWADKSLNTALASWAEMKHDTVLYGQQPQVAEQGEDGEEKQPNEEKGYVEPNLTLYVRMKSLVVRLKTELDKRTYLSSESRGRFNDFANLLDFFIAVSKKEIAGKPLSEAQYERIRKIEGPMEDLNISLIASGLGHRPGDPDYAVLSPDDGDPALVADFATNNDMVQEAAVGRADSVYAIVRVEGKLYLMRGAALSYYQFEHPSSDRMTDHAWKQILDSGGKLPPRPDWTHTYFITTKVKESF